ncbi:hypothetical protein B0T17DRAFT_258959 [Bombardia bombarda]|uniref:Uncharacterized protein n=1 Tax=Bombardia bombarda TaxID=252184 RepID=A0AA40C4S8_9PEZI|nr:hypothetical protein B0T17DRAFT_258959 [Bombardia bombarda]
MCCWGGYQRLAACLFRRPGNPSLQSGDDDDRPTALQYLCWLLSDRPHGRDISRLDSCDNYVRVEHLRFLVEECGANPNLKWEGRTAVETLLTDGQLSRT